MTHSSIKCMPSMVPSEMEVPSLVWSLSQTDQADVVENDSEECSIRNIDDSAADWGVHSFDGESDGHLEDDINETRLSLDKLFDNWQARNEEGDFQCHVKGDMTTSRCRNRNVENQELQGRPLFLDPFPSPSASIVSESMHVLPSLPPLPFHAHKKYESPENDVEKSKSSKKVFTYHKSNSFGDVDFHSALGYAFHWDEQEPNQHYQDIQHRCHNFDSPLRPTTPLSSSLQWKENLQSLTLQTPVRSAFNCSSDPTDEWLDPFPSPDSTVHRRFSQDSYDRLENRGNDRIPVSYSCNESVRNIQRKASLSVHMSLSSSRTLPFDQVHMRQTASDTNLPPSTSTGSLMEDFWKALQAGPDGNELWQEIEEKKKAKEKNRGIAFFNDKCYSHKSDLGLNRGLRRHGSLSDLKGVKLREAYHDTRNVTCDRKIAAHTITATPIHHKWRTFCSPSVLTPVRNLLAEQGRRASNAYRTNSQRAARIVRNTRKRLKERKDLRRMRRMARLKEKNSSWWIVISANHPYKMIWDIMTVIWALLGAYRTHLRIRDRVFDQSPLILVTEVWFTLDILLNFVTEHKTSKGEVIRDGRTVWARYLTSWFVIDLLSLIPWERIYIQPILEKINKRNIFQKAFFRSKAVIRVSRVLRGRHVKLIGRVSKQTGTPLRRLVRLVIKYLPKYLLFFQHMKGAMLVRGLRFIHWLHNVYKKVCVTATKARQSIVFRRQRKCQTIFDVNVEDCDKGDDVDSDSDQDEDDTDTTDEGEDDDESVIDKVITQESTYDWVNISNEHNGIYLHPIGCIQAGLNGLRAGSLRRRSFSESAAPI